MVSFNSNSSGMLGSTTAAKHALNMIGAGGNDRRN